MATQTGSYDFKAAKQASESATQYINEVSNNGIFVHQADSGKNGALPDLTTAYGVHISDDVDIIKAGKVVASYGDTATIGRTDGNRSHVEIDHNSLKMINSDSRVYFHVSDLRSMSGSISITERFYGDGTEQTFHTLQSFNGLTSVMVNNVDIKSSCTYFGEKKYVTLPNIPAVGTLIEITYISTDPDNYAFTLGTRKDSTIGIGSTTTGTYNTASGGYSVSFGYGNEALGRYSVALNGFNIAQKDYQTVIGTYNVADTTATDKGKYAFIIGNGTAINRKSNAFAVEWDGDVWTAKGNLIPQTDTTTWIQPTVSSSAITYPTTGAGGYYTEGKRCYVQMRCSLSAQLNANSARVIATGLPLPDPNTTDAPLTILVNNRGGHCARVYKANESDTTGTLQIMADYDHAMAATNISICGVYTTA